MKRSHILSLISSLVVLSTTSVLAVERAFERLDDPGPDIADVSPRLPETAAPPHIQLKLKSMKQFVEQNRLPFTVGYTRCVRSTGASRASGITGETHA